MTSPTAAPALSPTRRPTPTSVVAWLRRPTLPGVLLLGTAAVLLAMALTILDSGGHVALWENLHWTLASLIAVALGWIGVRRSSGHERTVRSLFLVAWLVYLGGR
ncbi:MAG TPA: hypothetical protein VGQ47_00210, partial [Candidatus Limnocylindrales bacterium]|nr:hypothetical protein [Candidatus Limnocylindrales bacterium]